MTESSSIKNSTQNKRLDTLSDEEALLLSAHLKKQRNNGIPIDSDQESISKMVAGLGDQRGLLRLRFADSLGAVGQAAVPALCEAMLSSDNVTVRRAAAKTLTLIKDPNSLPYLISAFLKDQDSVVQGSAMGAMAAIGEEAVTPILNLLSNPEITEMQIGLANWALAFVDDRGSKILRDASNSSNVEIRKAAITALTSKIDTLNADENIDLLSNASRDDDAEIRAEAATLLGGLEDIDWAKPLLISNLYDTDSWVRKNSALSLIKLNATEAIATLEECELQEEDQIVANVIKLAIQKLKQRA
ncbi:MAG: HEAT repeat domain-containing protein [Synechococcus sp. ArSW.bin.68]|jgi:bilin biosynthesis protein